MSESEILVAVLAKDHNGAEINSPKWMIKESQAWVRDFAKSATFKRNASRVRISINPMKNDPNEQIMKPTKFTQKSINNLLNLLFEI